MGGDFADLHDVDPAHAGIVLCLAQADHADLAARVDAAVSGIGQLAGELIEVR